uniref:Uncharacterized protein n=1 Tax=Bacteriophage sp. TaxID=38018 RepID=A0A8D9PEK2_9VIRU|nr:MAG TPA: hypothetical protein [Bacteriophage sp.]
MCYYDNERIAYTTLLMHKIILEVVVLQNNHTNYVESVINKSDFLHLHHSFRNLVLNYRLCR